MNRTKKRITMKLKNPNPLFEQWLVEWRDKAIEKDSKMQHCFKSALYSLRKYPLPLESGRDCKILKGFGEKLCQMLDTKLAEYKRSNPQYTFPAAQDEGLHTNNIQMTATGNNISSPNVKKKEYVPAYRSGPYAILISLYEASLKPQYPGYLFKTDIIKNGQHLCEKSFVRPDPGSYYTAWSSMKTLLEKNLVNKISSPAKYSLTSEGLLLSHKLYTNNLKDDNAESKDNSNCEMLSDALSSKLQKPSPKIKNNSSSALTTGEKNVKKSRKRVKKSLLVENGSSSALSSESEIIVSQESNSSETNNSATLSQEETFIFVPNSFDVILYVDKQEVVGYNQNPLDDVILSELVNLNVKYEVKHLKVGDYTWICRCHATNKELVLPYVIERKRMDDFGASVKDGRFHEQKFRLKQSGIQNLIYLIESHGNNTHTGLPMPTLYQAATNTLIQDHFSVKFTNNTRETVQYLATLTSILKNTFQEKTLVSCPKQNLSPLKVEDDLVSLMVFQEFNKGASKSRNFKVEELFIRQLLQLKGMSVEKAMAVIKEYPTPNHLRLAYEAHDENLLSAVQYGALSKKIGPVISKTLFQLYTLPKF